MAEADIRLRIGHGQQTTQSRSFRSMTLMSAFVKSCRWDTLKRPCSKAPNLGHRSTKAAPLIEGINQART